MSISTLAIDELRRQAKILGYRLEPIARLDRDKEIFASCLTREDVEVTLESITRPIDPEAIPSVQELERRREAVEQLRLAGVDPFKPARPSL